MSGEGLGGEYGELVTGVFTTRWGGLLPLGFGVVLVAFDQLPGAGALFALTGHPEWILVATGVGVGLIALGVGLLVARRRR